MKRSSCLVVLFYLLASFPATAQDVMTIGSVSAPAGTRVSVPVSVRDVTGTPLGTNLPGLTIQAFSLRVQTMPAASVSELTFERAGVLASLSPLYERLVPGTDSVSWLAMFDEQSQSIPFTSNPAAPGQRIGTISLTIGDALPQGTTIHLSLDPQTTALANEAGTHVETAFHRTLSLVPGVITVGGAATSVALSSSHNPSVAGNDVTFTATITSATAGAIGGTVYFLRDGDTLASAPVLSGVATFTTSELPEGTNVMVARFEGAGKFQPSVSTALHQLVNGPAIAAPAGLTAAAAGSSQVAVTWSPVANAASYEVLRRTSINGTYTVVGAATGTAFTDTTVAAGVTYLYAVRGVTSGGERSVVSGFDPATTVAFTDAALQGRTVKRIHLIELRNATQAFRLAAGLPAATLTDEPLPARALVLRVHVAELRAALAEARAALAMPSVPVTDASLAGPVPIRAAHFEELRNAVN